jgi:hypothetical protein
MCLEPRLVARDEREELANGSHNRVHVKIDMVAGCQRNLIQPYLPIASARSLARFLVSMLEFSVPM